MTIHPVISPVRRALNPILADETMIEPEDGRIEFFYTPTAHWIERHIEFIIAGCAGVFLAAAWLMSLLAGPKPLQDLFTLLAFAVGGIPALQTVWSKLNKFTIDIDLLMLLGAGLAAVIGSPFEGALLLFLFALSGGLEEFALRRTQSALTSLHELTPKDAILLDGEHQRRVPLRQIAIGARVLVRPGEKVPTDGVVVAGRSSLDESAITGESLPRDCGEGDNVLAGTKNLNGRLEVQVSKTAIDSTLARMVQLVTDARRHPAAAQRLIDRIGPTYSIVVMVGAVAVGLINALLGVDGAEAAKRGIAVLIVASPCALIIATPVAYLAAMAAAARRGVLVKGGAHLETLARAGAIAFDKTGTLTTGQVRLTKVDPGDGLTEPEVLRIAGAVERSSNHPLAEAVARALTDRGIATSPVADYHATPGEGATATVEGRKVWVGRPEALSRRVSREEWDQASSRAERIRRDGQTASAVNINEKIAFLGFADTLRNQAKECIARLKRQGVRRVEMLTGDHDIVAAAVAEKLGLDTFSAGLHPEDKLSKVESLRSQFGAIVLVGDGINDAPALARADVGIAIGARRVDVAMDAAHIVLMSDRIEEIAWLHAHARRTAKIVRQNLTLAIGVITVLSCFAAMGNVPLPLAVVGHEGSTVLVALNALRLLRGRSGT